MMQTLAKGMTAVAALYAAVGLVYPAQAQRVTAYTGSVVTNANTYPRCVVVWHGTEEPDPAPNIVPVKIQLWRAAKTPGSSATPVPSPEHRLISEQNCSGAPNDQHDCECGPQSGSPDGWFTCSVRDERCCNPPNTCECETFCVIGSKPGSDVQPMSYTLMVVEGGDPAHPENDHVTPANLYPSFEAP